MQSSSSCSLPWLHHHLQLSSKLSSLPVASAFRLLKWVALHVVTIRWTAEHWASGAQGVSSADYSMTEMVYFWGNLLWSIFRKTLKVLTFSFPWASLISFKLRSLSGKNKTKKKNPMKSLENKFREYQLRLFIAVNWWQDCREYTTFRRLLLQTVK